MSVSALIGSSSVGVIKVKSVVRSGGGVNANGVMIECSSRPQKKATAHHMKTRPRKSAPWDVKRGPTVYPPLPPMPPEWTLLVATPSDDAASAVAQDPSTPPEN